MDVGSEEVFIEADTQHQGAAGARPDHHARFAGADHSDAESSFQALHRQPHCREQIVARCHQAVHQVHHHFGVGI